MAQNIKTIENGIREFVTEVQAFSFKLEFNEKYSAILVCYEEIGEVAENDPVWDELIILKNKLEEKVGEGNVLFSHKDTLFSVSPEAIVISVDTNKSGIITFSSKPEENLNLEYMGDLEPYYNKMNIDYCLAA